jgi:hypothetical protein
VNGAKAIAAASGAHGGSRVVGRGPDVRPLAGVLIRADLLSPRFRTRTAALRTLGAVLDEQAT